MTSVQRFLANHTNAAVTAALTASSVKASSIFRAKTATKSGNGRVKLSGSYTGHEDALFDLEVASGGGTLRSTSPTFSGIGNGTLSASVTGAATAQSVTLTLADLGTETTSATLDISGVIITAKAAGSAGNLVRITITPALTRTATDYSLLSEWAAGEETQAGVEFDFGGLPLNAKGEMDPATPRYQFGNDFTVYRPYRIFKDGDWLYGLSPAPKKAIETGQRAYSVTGGYTAVVTNGTTTETYPGLVTLYDFLIALVASALVEVEGTITVDRTRGGMAMIDLPLRTSSWVLATRGPVLDSIVPAADAPTETIRVECLNADAIGQEVWSVAGAISGNLGQAITGTPFTSGAISFTVPDKSSGITGEGAFSSRYQPVAREVGDLGVPDVCIKNIALGINAKQGTYTWTYEERLPSDTCSCEDATIIGRITAACLGLEGASEMALDAEYQSRLNSLYLWRSGLMKKYVSLGAGSPNISQVSAMLVDAITKSYQTTLADIYSVVAARTAWDAAFVDAQADIDVIDGNATVTSTTSNMTAGSFAGTFTIGNSYTNVSNGMVYVVTRITDASGNVRTSPATVTVDGTWSGDYDTEFSKVSGAVTVYFQRRSAALDANAYFNGGSSTPLSAAATVAEIMREYDARMHYVQALAGIVPKSDASSIKAAGDGCWRDYPEVTGYWVDQTGTYFPVFTNTAYVSTKQSCTTGASAGIPLGQPYSSKEFGFAIAVGCEDRLKAGDTVSITIGSVDGESPYKVGDVSEIDVVTAGPKYFSGGVNGTDEQIWRVSGSVDGLLDTYAVPTDGSAVPAYTDAGITLQLVHGGLEFGLGDTFSFGVEASQFRWRKNSGSWSSYADIDASVTLADGVSAQFEAGAAPSYVAGDTWQFFVEQANAPSHIGVSDEDSWAWTGATSTLVSALGAATDISAVAIARYDLPPGAAVTIEGGDGTTWPHSVALDISGDVAAAILPSTWSVTHVRISVTGATDGRIGWFWCGVPVSTTHSATTCKLVRQYAISRGNGYNPSQLYAGQGYGGEVGWENWLTHTDLAALLAMLDHMQQTGEAMIFVPNANHTSDATLVRVDFDQVEISDVHEFQTPEKSQRMISFSMQLQAVIQ